MKDTWITFKVKSEPKTQKFRKKIEDGLDELFNKINSKEDFTHNNIDMGYWGYQNDNTYHTESFSNIDEDIHSIVEYHLDELWKEEIDKIKLNDEPEEDIMIMDIMEFNVQELGLDVSYVYIKKYKFYCLIAYEKCEYEESSGYKCNTK